MKCSWQSTIEWFNRTSSWGDWTLFADNHAEAAKAADELEKLMDKYGSGEHAVRVAVIPDDGMTEPYYCPFDTVCLTAGGLAAMRFFCDGTDRHALENVVRITGQEAEKWII